MDWDAMYFFCREFFGMTKHEFLFEHNKQLIYDLVTRHFEFHGATKGDSEPSGEPEVMSARDFF